MQFEKKKKGRGEEEMNKVAWVGLEEVEKAECLKSVGQREEPGPAVWYSSVSVGVGKKSGENEGTEGGRERKRDEQVCGGGGRGKKYEERLWRKRKKAWVENAQE